MLFKVFADTAVPIRCRGCGARFTKVLGELMDQPEFGCPSCDGRFDASTVVAELKQAVSEREPCHAGSDGEN